MKFNKHKHDDKHNYSVEIEKRELKKLTIQEVADLWKIDSRVFLLKIIKKFNLKKAYGINDVLENIQKEHEFSPAEIKNITKEIKQNE